jgi:hypothetical protein
LFQQTEAAFALAHSCLAEQILLCMAGNLPAVTGLRQQQVRQLVEACQVSLHEEIAVKVGVAADELGAPSFHKAQE